MKPFLLIVSLLSVAFSTVSQNGSIPQPQQPPRPSNGSTPILLDLYVCTSAVPSTQTILTVCAVALIIIGIAMILYGYKTIRLIAFAIGFCVLFVVAYIVIDRYIAHDFTLWGKVGIAAAVGVIAGGLLAYFVEQLPFIIGFGIGLLVTSLILATPIGPQAFNPGNWLPLVSLILGGVAGGVIGWFLRKWIMMLVSAFLGSLLIAYSVDCAWFKTHFTMVIPNIIAMHKFTFVPGNYIPYILIGGIVLLTVVGFFFQAHKREKKSRKRQHG